MAAMELLFVDSQPAVKSEPLSNYDNEEETHREKIGDIYRTSMEHLAFVCTHCAAEFPLFIQFSKHIQQHLIDIHSNAFMSNAKMDVNFENEEIDVKPSIIRYGVVADDVQSTSEGIRHHGAPMIHVEHPKWRSEKAKATYSRKGLRSRNPATSASVDSSCQKVEASKPAAATADSKSQVNVNFDNKEQVAKNDDCSSDWSGHWSDDSITKIDQPTVEGKKRRRAECSFKSSTYECYICHASFRILARCNKHIREHNSSTFAYKCNYCNNKFLRKKHSELHAAKCGPTNPFKCAICPLTFRSAVTMQLHIHSFGDGCGPAVTQLYTCSACGAAYRHKADLARHMQIHAIPLMKCEYNCDYDTYVPSNYVAHVKDCPRKVETCPVCQKVFRKRYKFQTHMMRHQNVRNRQCAKCGKRFTTGSGLAKHMFVHEGENQYKCDQCPRTYKRLDALTAHKRSHTGEHLKMCKFCPRSFVDKRSLKRHSLKVHNRPFDDN